VDRALLDGLGDESHFTLFLHLPLLLWLLGRNKQCKAQPTSHKHNDDDEHMDRSGPCPYRLPQLRDANTTLHSLDLNTNTHTQSKRAWMMTEFIKRPPTAQKYSIKGDKSHICYVLPHNVIFVRSILLH